MESRRTSRKAWVAALAAALAGLAQAETMPPPSLLLSRYTANLDQGRPFDCRRVAVDIEAELPNLSKRGRLRAIRHLLPGGKSEYEVLQTEGDATVRRQVIARYLTAEAHAETMPSASVAVTAANYKFRYVGTVGAGKALVYVFQISPRRKRVGLLRGELWIDVSTATAVRKAGRMAKSPSLFLRRVDVVQDTDIRDGRPYLRITRLDIQTRLVGRAELTVAERLCSAESDPEVGAGPARSTDEEDNVTP